MDICGGLVVSTLRQGLYLLVGRMCVYHQNN